MRRKEAILQSPLRILDRAIRGGLGEGRLGAILAPAGVGKSACLVQLGLDALLRDRPVLHVAVGQPVDHVSARYDALFEDLAERFGLADRADVREAMARRRLIWSVAEGGAGAPGLDEAIAAFRTHLALAPRVILVDGLDWEGPDRAATVAAMKAAASGAGAELWTTAPDALRRELSAGGGAAALVDVALALEPRGRSVRLALVKGGAGAVDVRLVLEAGLLTPAEDGEGAAAARWPEGFTLLATGSAGAEEEFGACAERWGVAERNFTFAGRREHARTRGLVELSEDELRAGAVSDAYVEAHLHRTFAGSPELQRVLQLIWHQVSAAGEIFAVGLLNPDRTAHGGTGWAVELARHWAKPVHLFDEERKGWFRWDGREWAAEAPPAIARRRFAGAGTRSLSGDGRAAIRALFERTFGPPP